MEIASTIVAIFAFFFSIAAFVITIIRSRKLEEIRMTHEVIRNFYETENKILEVDHDKEFDLWKLRHLQYLNMWEWLSFLVNHGQLKNRDLQEYFKPMLKRDYKTVLGHAEFEAQRDNPEDFKEFKELYKKWSN